MFVHGSHRAARRGAAQQAFVCLSICAALAAASAPAAPCAPSGRTVLARLETTAHDAPVFFLRATLPVPRDSFSPGDRPPFAVVDAGGGLAPTQIEAVSRYASRHDGADVIEVLALVRRPPGAQPGEAIAYDLVRAPHEAAPFRTHAAVQALLATPGSLQLSTRDVLGNVYRADLLRDLREGNSHLRRQRSGEIARQHSTHEVLLPEVRDGGAYPHMMGVHAFVTEWSDAGLLSLDLHVHNGMSGLDPVDVADDAMDKLYFDSLELTLPSGWQVLTAFDSPALGALHEGPQRNVLPVVAPSPDGRLHVLGRQAHLVRRMLLARPGWQREARALVEERGLAFCADGRNRNGSRLWSWWNPDTPRYWTQNQRLPGLEHVGREQLRAELASRLAHFAGHVAAGTEPGYPVLTQALGYAQPWGIRYGGQTGGDEIVFYEGIDVAAGASTEGYRLAQLTYRLYVDRQRSALYDADGRPTRLESWLLPNGAGEPYVPMVFFGVPNIDEADPFGFRIAPTFHEDLARAQDRLPLYEGALLTYFPIDLQHYIRYTRSLKTLAWLGNDALAKSELEMAAANARLSYHEFHQNAAGTTASGLRGSMDYVAAYPGWGLSFGRGQGWLVDTAVAAYALGTDELRGRYLPWFEKIADLVARGQSACTGIIQATGTNKIAGGRYRIMQSFETSIVENMLVGLRSSVFEDVDEPRHHALRGVLARSLGAQVSPLVWRPQFHGPVDWMAVGPRDFGVVPFCGPPPREEAQSQGADGVYCWADFAYGYALTGDVQFLRRASEAAGGADLLPFLRAAGLHGLAARAPLLALMQEGP